MTVTRGEEASVHAAQDSFYTKLPRYRGSKIACDNCARHFFSGEKISVSTDDHVFCYSDGSGGCVMGFLLTHGKIVQSRHMRFGNDSLPAEKRRPNYPHIPVSQETATRLKTPWHQRASRSS